MQPSTVFFQVLAIFGCESENPDINQTASILLFDWLTKVTLL